MSKPTWDELQAAIPWDVLHDDPAPVVASVALPAPTAALSPAMRRRIALGFVVALLAGGVVLFALGRASMLTARPADVAPTASFLRATPAPRLVIATPGVILYRDIVLTTTPDATRWHGYALMCHGGETREFAGLDELRAWAASNGHVIDNRYASSARPRDCACYMPRTEAEGWRECEKER